MQRFRPIHRIEGVSLKLVTWGRNPSRYTINWRVVGFINGHTFELGAGKIDAGSVRDWQTVMLPLSTTSDEMPNQIEVSFRTDASARPGAAVSIPLYRPIHDNSAPPPAEIGGTSAPSGALLGLSLSYSQ